MINVLQVSKADCFISEDIYRFLKLRTGNKENRVPMFSYDEITYDLSFKSYDSINLITAIHF